MVKCEAIYDTFGGELFRAEAMLQLTVTSQEVALVIVVVQFGDAVDLLLVTTFTSELEDIDREQVEGSDETCGDVIELLPVSNSARTSWSFLLFPVLSNVPVPRRTQSPWLSRAVI